ncbi:STAS/SEC14 domain-containing protein [Neptuniibacter caesariensis]|uniref:STAS/SEC14 domain-containing protein n=1 Tax=Neptuniibacter caesariensis TaxID=207954 RepID=A0A7U8C6B5_NEPCE|nr:STAS/SEC14 domain-containing protein [Neptuniibacter caesariensis]EAR62333.1 hypothetical protein MED92_14888 [Oceanospirillum sp. MED92] [Neptuniibacter caesariensis]
MLYVLPETTGDIIVLQANGTLTTQDYTETFLPLFEHVKNTHPEVRLLITFAPDFEGFEAGAIWEDAKFGLHHNKDFYRVAIVSNEKWMEWMTKVADLLTQGEMRHYRMTQLLEALRWINDEGEDDEEKELYPFNN